MKQEKQKKNTCDMTSFASYLANQQLPAYFLHIGRVPCNCLCFEQLHFIVWHIIDVPSRWQNDEDKDEKDSILQRNTMNILNIVYYVFRAWMRRETEKNGKRITQSSRKLNTLYVLFCNRLACFLCVCVEILVFLLQFPLLSLSYQHLYHQL